MKVNSNQKLLIFVRNLKYFWSPVGAFLKADENKMTKFFIILSCSAKNWWACLIKINVFTSFQRFEFSISFCNLQVNKHWPDYKQL